MDRRLREGGEKEVEREERKWRKERRRNSGLLCDQHSSRPVALRVELLQQSE